jgi:hypothetical protein
MTSDKTLFEEASSPPKPLREFMPFMLPIIFVVLGLTAQGMLLWITRDYGDGGLYVQNNGHYVQVLRGIREFILTLSLLNVLSFGLTCVIGYRLWEHKMAIHELWKKTQN